MADAPSFSTWIPATASKGTLEMSTNARWLSSAFGNGAMG
jgi:hypothetical protein